MIRKRWWPTQLGRNYLVFFSQSFDLIIFNLNIQKSSWSHPSIYCVHVSSRWLFVWRSWLPAAIDPVQSRTILDYWWSIFLCFEFKSHHVLITKPPIFQRWGGFLQLITFVGRYWMIFKDQKWRNDQPKWSKVMILIYNIWYILYIIIIYHIYILITFNDIYCCFNEIYRSSISPWDPMDLPEVNLLGTVNSVRPGEKQLSLRKVCVGYVW